MQSAFTFQF